MSGGRGRSDGARAQDLDPIEPLRTAGATRLMFCPEPMQSGLSVRERVLHALDVGVPQPRGISG
jgi:hypothetical protein